MRICDCGYNGIFRQTKNDMFLSVLVIVFLFCGGVLWIGELRQAAREVGAVDVPHFGALGLEVLLVLLGDGRDHRHPPHHGEPVALEPDELGRVVGHQPHRAHADVTEYLKRTYIWIEKHINLPLT